MRTAKKHATKNAARHHGRIHVHNVHHGHPHGEGLAWAVFAAALLVAAFSFAGAWYYSATPFAIIPAGTNYQMALAVASDGTANSTNYRLTIGSGDAAAGTSKSTSYVLLLGSQAYLGGDNEAPVCSISQSTGTPAIRSTVLLTASCTDDVNLEKVELATDESGTLQKVSKYGSPKSVSGANASVTFNWLNTAVGVGKAVTWKVFATDTSGNIGESTLLAFTVGAPPDTTPPALGVVSVNPAKPAAGAEATVSVQATDETGLAGASLIIGNVTAGSVSLTGKAATVNLSWTPEKTGTYNASIIVTDGAGNIAHTDVISVIVIIPVFTCDPAIRPNDTAGPCLEVDVGVRKQTATHYTCDTDTGQWVPKITQQSCALPTPSGPPVAFIALGLVALVIAIAAALYILYKRGKIKLPPWLTDILDKLKMPKPGNAPAPAPEVPETTE